jgi:hypothetical protein
MRASLRQKAFREALDSLFAVVGRCHQGFLLPDVAKALALPHAEQCLRLSGQMTPREILGWAIERPEAGLVFMLAGPHCRQPEPEFTI